MTSEDVINRLAELFAMHVVPECIRSDNGGVLLECSPKTDARAI